MRYEIKSYNDFCFSLEIVRFGSGITGLSPQILIKRFGTAEYWDGTTWSLSVTTFSMIEIDSVNLPGLYVYDFNVGPPSIDTSVDTRYLVMMTETTQPITEYINVTINRFDDIISNNQNIVQNIADFFDATTGFNASSSTIGTVTDITNTVDSNVVDWNGTSPTLTKDAATDLPEVATSGVTDGTIASIANSILDASIWNPIVDPSTLIPGPSSRDTIARAITSSYLANVYKSDYDFSSTEDIYTCSFTDGTKFYSSSLPSLSKMEYLVGKSAKLFKGWDGASTPTMADWSNITMRITEVGVDGNGKFLTLEDPLGNSNTYTSGADSIIILNNAGIDSTAIATAVWDEPVASHSVDGSFGMLTRIIGGLVHFNHRIKDTEYDQTGRMTGCRIVVYPSASDAEADTNPLSTIIVSSTYNSANNMSTYLATEESGPTA